MSDDEHMITALFPSQCLYPRLHSSITVSLYLREALRTGNATTSFLFYFNTQNDNIVS